MKRLYCIACFLLITSWLKAQSTKTFQVHFDTNSYKISKKNEAFLDKEIEGLKKIGYPYYTIEIIGYTDNTGTPQFNKTLSENRAKSITEYFVAKGFSKRNIIAKGNSSNNPIAANTTEDGKSKNRRVNIQISLSFNDVVTISKFREKPTIYKVNTQKEKTITHKSGTKITIPENSFVDKNGKDVAGEVEIKYIEFRKPIDFILAGITMDYTDNGKSSFFNSGGMFKITAFKNGEAIILKKDKSVNIDFTLTNAIPNLNFYKLDTVANQWKEIAKISNQNGLRFSGMLGCGRDTEKPQKCPLTLCESLYYIKDIGTGYAESEISLFNQANYTNPATFQKMQLTMQNNKEKIASNENRLKIISKKMKSNTISYQLNWLEEKGKDIFFEITAFNNPNSESETFTKVKWKCPKEAFSKDIISKKWRICSIEKAIPEDYLIILKDSLQKTYTTKASIETKKRIRKRKREAYLSDLIAVMNKNAIEIKKNDSICKTLTNEKLHLEKNNKILSNYRKGNDNQQVNEETKKNIECFIQYSREIMPQNELSMDENTWLNYFDANREMMLQRYSTLHENEKYKKCIEMQIEAEKQRLLYIETQRQAQLNNEKALYLVQSFRINDLGIYNCDQINRLENPVQILAEYKDDRGKTINPNFIYLIDEKVNGIIRYDSTNSNLNPSHFAFNPESKNIILAFDADGESYIFSAKKVKKLKTSPQTTEKNTLILEKIHSKKQIENELL